MFIDLCIPQNQNPVRGGMFSRPVYMPSRRGGIRRMRCGSLQMIGLEINEKRHATPPEFESRRSSEFTINISPPNGVSHTTQSTRLTYDRNRSNNRPTPTRLQKRLADILIRYSSVCLAIQLNIIVGTFNLTTEVAVMRYHPTPAEENYE